MTDCPIEAAQRIVSYIEQGTDIDVPIEYRIDAVAVARALLEAEGLVARLPEAKRSTSDSNSVRAELVEALQKIANMPPQTLPSRLVDQFIEMRLLAKGALDLHALAKAEGSPTSERDAVLEEAAKVCEPGEPKPCDCISLHDDTWWLPSCDCRNGGDSDRASQWCESMNNASRIRALKADSPTCERPHIPHVTESI